MGTFHTEIEFEDGNQNHEKNLKWFQEFHSEFHNGNIQTSSAACISCLSKMMLMTVLVTLLGID